MTTRRARRDTRWKIIKLTFFMVMFAGIFSLICLRTNIVNLRYEINTLQDRKTEFLSEEKLMAAEKANVYSFEKIEEAAIRLGMKLPDRKNIIFVKKVSGAAPFKVSAKPSAWGD
jgi:cell division protein FtsL